MTRALGIAEKESGDKEHPFRKAPEETSLQRGRGHFEDRSSTVEDVAQGQRSGVLGFVGEERRDHREILSGSWDSDGLDEPEREDLSGSQATLDILRKTSDTELVAAFKARARGGNFRTRRSGGGSSGYSAFGGYDSSASGSARADTSGLIPALEAAGELAFKAGAGIDADAQLMARLWQLEFTATGSVSLFAGFEASAAGKVYFNATDGLGAEGEASALLGARASLSGEATVKLGPAELTAMATVAAQAGLMASAKGKIAINFDGVELSGEAEVFAGFKATVGGSAEAKFRGKTIIKASGEIGVAFGAGASAKGKFEFKNGKLVIEIGAMTTAIVGGEIALGAEIDFYALAEAIGNVVYERYAAYANAPTDDIAEIVRDPIADAAKAERIRDQGYETYIDIFRTYQAKKMKQGEHGIKRERVQELLDGKRGVMGLALAYNEADEGIRTAAIEAFSPLLTDITIVGGRITDWRAAEDLDIGEARQAFKDQQAVEALRTALENHMLAERAAAADKAGKADYRPDITALNAVLTKHGKAVIGGFDADSADQADALISGLISTTYRGIFSQLTVTGGQITAHTLDDEAITTAEQGADEDTADAARLSALADIETDCAAYAAKSLRAKKDIAESEVAAIVAKHAGAIQSGGPSRAADRAIYERLRRGLNFAVLTIGVKDGAISVFKPRPVADVQTQVDKRNDAAQRRQLYVEAGRKFSAYLTEKTKIGDNGVKKERVQKIVNDTLKKIPPLHHPEAFAELETLARSAFASMLKDPEKDLTIKGGVVTLVTDRRMVIGTKIDYLTEKIEQGRFLGEDDVNVRRYTIRRKVYRALETYKASLIANPKKKAVRGDLDAVLAKSLGSRTDLFQLDDARDYLATLINETLDGIAVVSIGPLGTLTSFTPDDARLGELRTKAADDKVRASALAAVLERLRPLAAKIKDGLPTMAAIDAAVAKASSKLDKLEPDERDAVLEEAVVATFGAERIRSMRFKGGKAASPPVPAR